MTTGIVGFLCLGALLPLVGLLEVLIIIIMLLAEAS
jgi:hypothetical protein